MLLHNHGFLAGGHTLHRRLLKKQYSPYLKKFKDTLAWKNNVGDIGLTEEKVALGFTMESKLEKSCPHFDDMHGPEVWGHGECEFLNAKCLRVSYLVKSLSGECKKRDMNGLAL